MSEAMWEQASAGTGRWIILQLWSPV